MSTSTPQTSKDSVKRKVVSTPKLPDQNEVKKKNEKLEVNERAEVSDRLLETDKKMPEQFSQPETSPRELGKGSSKHARKRDAERGGKDAIATSSTATTTTTTTTTAATTTTTAATTTTTTSATTTSSATSTTTSSATNAAGGSDSDRNEQESADRSAPRSHWMPYLGAGSEKLDYKEGLTKRGPVRRDQLQRMLHSMEINQCALFRKNANKPALWMKEFSMVAAPLWKVMLEALQAAHGAPEWQAAIAAPAQHIDKLENLFSFLVRQWAEQGREGIAKFFSPAMKAMSSELMHHFRLSLALNPVTDTQATFNAVLSDLLVFSLAENPVAPQPLTSIFCNYLAGFLGTEPTHVAWSGMSIEKLSDRINKWRFQEVLKNFKFDPLEDLRHAAAQSPLQKFEPLPGSADFNERATRMLKMLCQYNSIFGMAKSEQFKDPRLISTLRREFSGGGKWFEMRDGKKVELNGNMDAMHALFNRYPPQGAVAQLCCTQNLYHAALLTLMGKQWEESHFVNDGKQAVVPKFHQYSPEWTITRKEDDALEIDLQMLSFFEHAAYVKLVPNLDHEEVRSVLPGWSDLQVKVAVSTDCDITVEHLRCSAYNLTYLEKSSRPEVVETPGKSESKTMKKLRRLSMMALAPLSKEDNEAEAAPVSPRKGEKGEKTDRADKGNISPKSSFKPREKQKEKEAD